MAYGKQTTEIDPSDRLIFALDVPAVDQAVALVRTLKSQVRIFKIGMELFFAAGWDAVNRIAEEGKKEEVRIFLDLKLLDIPATMERTLKILQGKHGSIVFATIHMFNAGLGDFAALGVNPNFKIFAVSLLTSMDRSDLELLGISGSVEDFVLRQAEMAEKLGCDGVITSGLEAGRIKENFDLQVIAPGIRPAWATVAQDDQKRVTTPREAILNGADYIVVGRPIRYAEDPLEAAARIQEEIRGALEER